MQELIIESFHFSDERKNLGMIKPDEDYMLNTSNVFIVADGVTLLWKSPYPDPSPAYEAAKICCNSILGYLEDIETNEKSEQSIYEAFRFANSQIHIFNESNNINPNTVDYVNTQYASTVCSAGFIDGDYLYFGNINDCGILVLDNKNEVILNQIADIDIHETYLTYLRSQNIYTTPQEEHIYFRKNVVNKKILFNNDAVNFGVLTGEIEALDFVKINKIKINKGFKILFYSDGFIPHLKDQEFIKNILKNKDINEFINLYSLKDPKYQKEKSIIIVKI